MPTIALCMIVEKWGATEERGFTLIELLFVIIILGILLAIADVALSGRRESLVGGWRAAW